MNHPNFIASPQLESLKSVNHGFFTRQGGVSSGDFASLNCSLFSGDDPESILINRNRIVQSLGCHTIFSLKQIHSNIAVVVNSETDLNEVIEADALVTNVDKIALGVLGADCAAILFADQENRIIGAAHGGWQGALKGITKSVVETMCSMGASKECIVAAIGPAIQKSSYEVGEEFLARFLAESDIECEDCFSLGVNGQGILFDLPGYLELRILQTGVSQIDRLTEDTFSDEDKFFSYRRSCHRGDLNYGRQISAIGLV